MKLFIWMLLLYSIPFAFLMVTLLYSKSKKYYTLGKTLASLGFIVVAIVSGLEGTHLIDVWHTMPAFLLCLTGDVLLGIYNQNKQKEYFLAGLCVFLCGHIGFFLSFARMSGVLAWEMIIPVFGVMLTIWLEKRPGMNTEKLKVGILLYSYFVSLLLTKTIFMAVKECSAGTLLLAIGAGLFLISDVLLLFLNFYKKRFVTLHVLNLITYYYGIFLMAASFQFFS